MWPSWCHGCVCDFRWRCPYWSYYCDLNAGIIASWIWGCKFLIQIIETDQKKPEIQVNHVFLVHPLLSLVCHCPTRPFSSTEPESNIQQMVVNAFYLLNKPPTRIDPKKQHTTTVPFLERHSKDGNVKKTCFPSAKGRESDIQRSWTLGDQAWDVFGWFFLGNRCP